MLRKRVINYWVVALLLSPSLVMAMRDPTTPLGQQQTTAVVSVGGLQLAAIIVKSGKRIAIINGKHYQQGDSLGTIRVVKIEKDKVILSGDSGEFSLSMFGDSQQRITIKKR